MIDDAFRKIGQQREAAEQMLKALRLLMTHEMGSQALPTTPRSLVLQHVQAAIAAAEAADRCPTT